LAIDPTSRGFGFVVLEGPGFLVDWGTRDLGKADSAQALMHAAELIAHYQPDTVVLEDTGDRAARRRERVRALIEAIERLAHEQRTAITTVGRTEVHTLFRGTDGVNKRQIAQAIAQHFPELAPRLPPLRKAWMSEDTRMSIFDATAFALVFYVRQESASQQCQHHQPDAQAEETASACD